MDAASLNDRLRERIPEVTFTYSFARSSGPGGQNVNKVNTRVTLFFDVAGSDLLTADEKARIGRKLGGRMSNDGVLHVVSMRHRTQRANREAAIDRFFELLSEALVRAKPRKKTRISAGAKRRRLEDKRRRSETKQLRRRRSTDGY